MNRIEFMRQLESLLQNVSPTERQEALQYYNDYFDDAGAENEQDVIEALGNPAKVAENIKRDLYGSGYGDSTYQRVTANDKAVVEYHGNTSYSESVEKKNKMSTGMIVLLVIVCIFASPVILGVASGLIGVLVGIVAGLFGLILGLGAATVGLLMTMVVLVVVGVMCAFNSLLVGVTVIGIGFICGGLGILFLMATIALAGIAVPAIVKGFIGLCRRLFRKNK